MPQKKAKKPYRMPSPMPEDEVLTDIMKTQWLLGSSVGKGGFGEIYLAAPRGKTASRTKAEYVIKIEPLENGPLFNELAFYRRVAKQENISRWMKDKKLSHLAVPMYIGAGLHTFRDKEYRFMVIPRFGTDLDQCFKRAGCKFSEATVCYLALRLLEALEFLHHSVYVHADIKAGNVLVGLGKGQEHQIYLVDYGLASRYLSEGVHREYKEDPRRAHDGTLQFTSIDAHNGVSPSRRGDLEILGYCLLFWVSGSLPWATRMDKQLVAQAKKSYHGDASRLVKDSFKGSSPCYLVAYLSAVYRLDYTERPQYEQLKELFSDQIKQRDATKTLEWLSAVMPGKGNSEQMLPSVAKRRCLPVQRLKASSAPVLSVGPPNEAGHDSSSRPHLAAPPLPCAARSTHGRMVEDKMVEDRMVEDKMGDSLSQNKLGSYKRGRERRREEGKVPLKVRCSKEPVCPIPHKSAAVVGPGLLNEEPLRRLLGPVDGAAGRLADAGMLPPASLEQAAKAKKIRLNLNPNRTNKA